MRKKRYIILGLLCICTVYLFETYFLAPATENHRESLVKQYKTLQRYEYVVRGAGTTEDESKALMNDMKNTEKRLLTEKTDFLASAKMQGEITDLTGKAGLNVATIRPMAAVKMSDLTGKTGLNVATKRPMSAVKLNAYSVIQVYFEGNGNINQVSEFLKLVETDPLLLKIDKLSLNITNMQKPDDLKFKIQISGLSRT